MSSSILRTAIHETPWIDTHEHLVEERHRLGADGYRFRDVWGGETHIPGGWTGLISHYAVDDVISAGHAVRLDDGMSPEEQWDALAAGLRAARSTGYLRAVELTTERLFGLPFSRDACRALDRACRSPSSRAAHRPAARSSGCGSAPRIWPTAAASRTTSSSTP